MNHRESEKQREYAELFKTPTGDKWKRIGVRRRAGAAVPLFSIYSENSVGIGDFDDLKLLIDWCKEAGLTILQLLPLNEVGNDFSPYNAISSFAIDPMYISLPSLFAEYGVKDYSSLRRIRKRYRNVPRVDYRVKQEKINILRKSFQKVSREDAHELDNFISKNSYWINDYARFRSLNETKNGTLQFFCWVQWHLFKQLTAVKEYANRKGVLMMGDLPLLVSRGSADVWSHKNLFKLNLTAGAPPDMFYKSGQLWGMPPYNWTEIEKDGYVYIKERLKYAANFFDMFRIDHFIGLFRIWTVDKSSGKHTAGKGDFDPKDEREWRQHGKKILNAIIKSTDMLPCAEDLGTVPSCSPKVLRKYGICGTDWPRTLQNKSGFVSWKKYRRNSIAVLSTHDSSFFFSWWNYETKQREKKLFMNYLCRKVKYSRKCAAELIDANLETINRSASIFSVQLLPEWLALEPGLLRKMDRKGYRINYPGLVSRKNWSLKMPVSLEGMMELTISDRIKDMVKISGRQDLP